MSVRGIEAIKIYLPSGDDKKTIVEIAVEAVETQKLSNNKMTSVERYRQEWINMLRNLKENPDSLRDLAFNGDFKVSKFRSIYWSLLLRVLHGDPSTWIMQREQQRMRYERLKKEFIKNPHDVTALKDDDPLSQSTQSVWNQYFSDQELYNVINQDVLRTFPGVDFFRKPIIQNYMSQILFYYAREHPYMCYRQGMHEILAPIIFVLYGDHQGFLHFKEITKEEIDPILLIVIDPEHLEADSYSIFSRLMSSVESYYRLPQNAQTASPEKKVVNEGSNEIEVISQLNKIRDKILAKEDLHLHNHLLKLDIPLHIFGIRWLRLLFGREFPLLDLLVLWDAIFADSDHFDLPNYILVAMLIRIRDKLLLSDYTTALTYLMRYPTNVDVSLVLRHALHMLMPKKFERPDNAFIYCTINSTTTTLSKKDLRKNSQSFQRNSSKNEISHRTRSSSMNEVKLEKEIALFQNRNVGESEEITKNKPTIEGYLENSPEVLCSELKSAQTIIGNARNKLITYLETIRRHTDTNNSQELGQALNGIEELCTYLDVKFMVPLNVPMGPIDLALEANELQRRTRESTPTNISDIENSKTLTLANASEFTSSNSFMLNSLGAAISASKTPYEKPELVSSNLLAGRKEIELKTISSDEKAFKDTEPLEYLCVSNSRALPKLDPLSHREN